MAWVKSTPLTEKQMQAFCDALAECCHVGRACERAGITRTAACAERDQNPVFRREWDRCLLIGSQVLEEEAQRRAFEGDEQPVYNKDGDQIGTKLTYSDTLAMFLLKAHNPERFRDNHRVELTGANGGALEVNDTQLAVRLAAILNSAGVDPSKAAEPTGPDGEPLV